MTTECPRCQGGKQLDLIPAEKPKPCFVCDGKEKVVMMKESVVRRMSASELPELDRLGYSPTGYADPKTGLQVCIFPDKEFSHA